MGKVIDSGPPVYKVEPWEHQKRAYDFIRDKNGALLYCGMGTGKSRVVIDLINNDEDIWKVLIVCPLSVCKAWERQFALYGIRHTELAILNRGSVATKAIKADETFRMAEVDGAVAVAVVNYESYWRPAFAKFIGRQKFDLVVADECFTGDVRISVPGDRVTPIADLRVGDEVLGYDEETGEVVKTRVKEVFRRATDEPLLWWPNGGGVTFNHPVYADGKYVPAAELAGGAWCSTRLASSSSRVERKLRAALVPAARDGGCVEVHNIETGTGNYFANGILVHNCHRLKSPSGKASRFAARFSLYAGKRLGLTGTPAANNLMDIYAQFRFLDRSVFGNSYSKFKRRYGVWGGFQGYQLIGIQNEADFNKKFYSITFRADTEDVLDLPEVQHIPIPIELPPKARLLYNELEEEFIAGVGDGTVTVTNALTRLLRLQQVTSGHVRLDDEDNVVRLHTEKLDAVRDLMDGLEPGTPFVVFCRFVADLDMVHEAAEAAGRKSLELSGRRRELEAWQAGEADVLAVQIQAGSEGIDLTRAHYAAYFSLGFSLSQYDQSLARVHRPGQKNKVVYYHLIVEKSVDNRVYTALSQKKKVIEAVLEEYGSWDEQNKPIPVALARDSRELAREAMRESGVEAEIERAAMRSEEYKKNAEFYAEKGREGGLKRWRRQKENNQQNGETT